MQCAIGENQNITYLKYFTCTKSRNKIKEMKLPSSICGCSSQCCLETTHLISFKYVTFFGKRKSGINGSFLNKVTLLPELNFPKRSVIWLF